MKLKFFELAKKLSELSTYPQKLGAVIVDKNRIRGMGTNSTKTSPKANTQFKTVHAEFAAVINARSYDLSGCDIYVYRKNKRLARPCDACMHMLKMIGIRKVYYTNDGQLVEERIA